MRLCFAVFIIYYYATNYTLIMYETFITNPQTWPATVSSTTSITSQQDSET